MRVTYYVFWSYYCILTLHRSTLHYNPHIFVSSLSTVCAADIPECVAIYRQVVDSGPTRVIPIKKTDSLSPSSNQLPISPQLGMGFHVHLPSPCLDFCLTWLAQVLCTRCANVWLICHQCFVLVTQGFWSYSPPTPSSTMVPELWEERCDVGLSLSTENTTLWPLLSPWVHCYLLQGEAFLIPTHVIVWV